MMETAMKATQDSADADFVWDDYLNATSSIAAPPTAFSHVECSLESGFKIGMKLEVLNPEIQDCYWIASVVMTCGPLLTLRYIGYGEDRSADFWFNIKTSEFHPIGWCKRNNKIFYPPKGVRERCEDYMALLTAEIEENSIPLSLVQDLESGITPIDQIKCGMKLEVLDELNPMYIWPAMIIQNIGGRLLLRYEGSSINGDEDFWLFYLYHRIHALGWGADHSLCYHPPKGKNALSEEKRKAILTSVFVDSKMLPFPVHILEQQEIIKHHCFKVGMKLEIINPETLLDICPATVIEVINEYYFLVEVDVLKDTEDSKTLKLIKCCHANSSVIFPCGWAEKNGITLKPPCGYKLLEKFKWDEYLAHCNAVAAPRNLFCMNFMNMGFEVGMKLEAVNLLKPDQICVSTVYNIIEPLMWISLDNVDVQNPNHITSVDSLDIFPVGWCASNGYTLQTPSTLSFKKYNNRSSESFGQKEHSHCKSWCPKIFFNHRCFSGPLLSKSRLAELPQAIGPGPVDLVMKDVLTRLINVAYKSSRVLRELQISGKPDPNMQQQTIKAKYKGKSYRATVEFVCNSEQVEEFCRKICMKLDCCPYLFGPIQVGTDCPENCHTLTKTKFGNNFLKKHKKQNEALIETSVAEIVKKGPGRKKKRKHWRTILACRNNEVSEKNLDSSETLLDKNEISPMVLSLLDQKKEDLKTSHKNFKVSCISRTEINTRGTRILSFGSEKRWSLLSSSVSRHAFSRKVGRPIGSTTKKNANLARSRALLHRAASIQQKASISYKPIIKASALTKLDTNPLLWTTDDVVQYIRTTECAPFAYLFKEQEIDGQALLMLTFHTAQEFLHLKSEPAKALCSLIKNLKLQFLMQFVSSAK